MCRTSENNAETTANSTQQEAKKKKKKKKNKNQDVDLNANQELSNLVEEEKKAESSKMRTFANGLTVEELAMGKPDGKRASPGCKVISLCVSINFGFKVLVIIISLLLWLPLINPFSSEPHIVEEVLLIKLAF